MSTLRWVGQIFCVSASDLAWLVCRCDATALFTPDVWSEYTRGPTAPLRRRYVFERVHRQARKASEAAHKAPRALEQCEDWLEGGR